MEKETRPPKIKRFYCIMFQSNLMHTEWGIWASGMMTSKEAEGSLTGAARFYGKKHVRLLVSDDESMKKMLTRKYVQDELKK